MSRFPLAPMGRRAPVAFGRRPRDLPAARRPAALLHGAPLRLPGAEPRGEELPVPSSISHREKASFACERGARSEVFCPVRMSFAVLQALDTSLKSSVELSGTTWWPAAKRSR